MPPVASPGGLDLKRLPPWAWVLAIAGGAVVGFVLLKPGEPAAPEEQGEGTGGQTGASADRTDSAVVVEPLSDDLARALGLAPGDLLPASYGPAGDSGGSGGPSSDSSPSSDSQAAPETLSGSGIRIQTSSPSVAVGTGYATTVFQQPAPSSAPSSAGGKLKAI